MFITNDKRMILYRREILTIVRFLMHKWDIAGPVKMYCNDCPPDNPYCIHGKRLKYYCLITDKEKTAKRMLKNMNKILEPFNLIAEMNSEKYELHWLNGGYIFSLKIKRRVNEKS